MAALVSCIVPCFNGERYLGEAIESVLAQDHRPIELIVVDDGSTDGSVTLAREYDDLVCVVQEKHGGPVRARNTGILSSHGDYVGFLDADDLYLPGKLSAQVAELDTHPDIDYCLCTAENFWEPGLEEERDRYVALGKVRATHHLGTLLARRSMFDRVGLLDARREVADDTDWFLRASDAKLRSHVLADVLYARRMHADSHSHGLVDLEPYLDFVKERIDARRRAASPADSQPPGT